MRILLTGGGGLVAAPLARYLARAHDVAALPHAELDVTDAAAVAAAVASRRPDRVVHLAAWTDVDGCERDPGRADAVNAEGTRHVAQACGDAGLPLLYVSTDYVYDGRKDSPYTEDDPVGPASAYGRSKLEGERHVRTLVPRAQIARCQSIYGAAKKSFVDAVLARAAAGEPLRVVTDQRVSPSWSLDVAQALATLLLRAGPGTYLVANAGSCTWYECARAALDLRGFGDRAIEPITAAALARPAPRPANSAFSCARLLAATGLLPRPWRDALAAYLSSSATADAAGRVA